MTGRVKREKKIERIPIIGKLKIGEKIKKSNGKEFPTSLDYFKPAGKYSEFFNQAYGEKPTLLQVLFVSDDIREVCNERFELWNGSKLYGWGDGESFSIWNEQKKEYKNCSVTNLNDFFVETENRVNSGNRDYKITWKHVLTLRFLLLKLTGVMGVWELTTRGTDSSIPNIVGIFDKVKEVAGTVTKVVFDLQIDMGTSHKMGEVKKYPVLSLIPNVSAPNLEKLKQYIDNNVQLPFKVDDAYFSKQQNTENDKQLEYKQNDEIIDAEIVNNSNPNDKQFIHDMFDSCESFPDLNSVLKTISEMDLDAELKKFASECQNKTVQRLRS